MTLHKKLWNLNLVVVFKKLHAFEVRDSWGNRIDSASQWGDRSSVCVDLLCELSTRIDILAFNITELFGQVCYGCRFVHDVAMVVIDWFFVNSIILFKSFDPVREAWDVNLHATDGVVLPGVGVA